MICPIFKQFCHSALQIINYSELGSAQILC